MNRGNHWGNNILLVITLLAFASCGGGDIATDVQFGSNEAPVVVGDLSNGGTGSNPTPGSTGGVTGQPATPAAPELNQAFFVPEAQIGGVSSNAPLGTNPDYNVRPAGGLELDRQAAKAGSTLVDGEQFSLDWIAITADLPDGETPEGLPGFDPLTGINQGPFDEGTPVDLWMAYEVASGNTLHREWRFTGPTPEFSFTLVDDEVTYLTGGDYAPGSKLVKFNYILPIGSAGETTLECALTNGPKASSLVVVTDPTVLTADLAFEVRAIPTSDNELPGVLPPADDPPDCMPDWINVDFVSPTSVDVESEKELSNVVLKFADYTTQKHDDLSGYTGTFSGTGGNAGKTIIGVWVKSGCNASGDGPGFGQFFPAEEKYRHATMVWEDLLVNSDYDYNDLVASMHCKEIYDSAGNLLQVDMTIKALARGAGYGGDWQFNVESAFDGAGADVQAIVRQYYANGTPHGDPRIWDSGTSGACVPVFAPVSEALPIPPDHNFATNVVPHTTYIEGDYAEVTITFNPALPAGTFESWPYDPELRVKPSGSYSELGTYIVKLWRSRDDNATRLDQNGRPLAFIVPDTFAWPLERVRIETAFPAFTTWLNWVHNGGTEPSPLWSETEPVSGYFDRALFH